MCDHEVHLHQKLLKCIDVYLHFDYSSCITFVDIYFGIFILCSFLPWNLYRLFDKILTKVALDVFFIDSRFFVMYLSRFHWTVRVLCFANLGIICALLFVPVYTTIISSTVSASFVIYFTCYNVHAFCFNSKRTSRYRYSTEFVTMYIIYIRGTIIYRRFYHNAFCTVLDFNIVY